MAGEESKSFSGILVEAYGWLASRPLIPVGVAFAAGIGVQGVTFIPMMWLLAVFCVVALAIILAMLARRQVYGMMIVVLCFVSGAIWWAGDRMFSSARSVGKMLFEGASYAVVRVRGKVASSVECFVHNGWEFSGVEGWRSGRLGGVRGHFYLDVEEVRADGVWREADFTLRVTLTGVETVPEFVVGDDVEILGRLVFPRGPRNPGQFDYADYLLRKRVSGLLLVSESSDMKLRARWFDGVPHPGKFWSVIDEARSYLSRRFDETFLKETAAVAKRILIGKQGGIDNVTSDRFLESGTMHVLAISGLHISLVVALVWGVLRRLPVRRSVQAVVLIVVAGLYAALAGFRPPTIRAFVMTSVFFLGDLLGRRKDTYTAIALAGLILLVARPGDLFDVGFQLSFAAVIAIVVLFNWFVGALSGGRDSLESLTRDTRSRHAFFRGARRWLAASLVTSVAAWVGTMPITAYHFNVWTPIVVVANLIVIPLVWLLLASGFVMMSILGMGWCAQSVAQIFGQAFAGIVFVPFDLLARAVGFIVESSSYCLLHTCKFLADIPYSHFYVRSPSTLALCAYCLAVVICLLKGRIKFWKVFTGLALGMLLLSAYADMRPRTPLAKEATFIDVGHGLSVLVRFPSGENLLYDAGSLSNSDVGRSIIAPCLWEKGVYKIDHLVLSHPEIDHISAVPALLRRFIVGHVYLTRKCVGTPLGEELLGILQKNRIPYSFVSLEDGRILAREGFVVEVLHPPAGSLDDYLTNDSSMVIRICDGRGETILLTGDVEAKGIKTLLSSGRELRAAVVSIPHHGGYAKGIEELARSVSPRYAVVSCGRHFAAERTIEAFEEVGSHVLATCNYGAITFTFEADGIRADTHLSLREEGFELDGDALVE